MFEWLRKGGRVGIYDATNSTKSRRQLIMSRCTDEHIQVIFIESICEDPGSLHSLPLSLARSLAWIPKDCSTSDHSHHIIFFFFTQRQSSSSRPYERQSCTLLSTHAPLTPSDSGRGSANVLRVASLRIDSFEGVPSDDAIKQFQERIEHYTRAYETVDEDEYVRSVQVDRAVWLWSESASKTTVLIDSPPNGSTASSRCLTWGKRSSCTTCRLPTSLAESSSSS
jgi:hypothetical protein